jgi:hypothetical protein
MSQEQHVFRSADKPLVEGESSGGVNHSFFFTLWQFLAVRPRRPRPLVPVCLSPAAVQWLLQWSLPSEQAQQPSLLDAGRESSGKSLLDGLS